LGAIVERYSPLFVYVKPKNPSSRFPSIFDLYQFKSLTQKNGTNQPVNALDDFLSLHLPTSRKKEKFNKKAGFLPAFSADPDFKINIP
jgi:hypothetical protein